jgi:hypothetical protein
MTINKHIISESRNKKANDPQFIPSDNIDRYTDNFSNRAITIERGIRDDVNVYRIDTLFDELGWSGIYNMKNPIYLTLIIMFFVI